MKWIKLKKRTPSHKDLVLCLDGNGVPLPAIYYSNQDFEGFYPFTTYYHSNHYTNPNDAIYSQVRYEKMEGIVEWMPMPYRETKKKTKTAR